MDSVTAGLPERVWLVNELLFCGQGVTGSFIHEELHLLYRNFVIPAKSGWPCTDDHIFLTI